MRIFLEKTKTAAFGSGVWRATAGTGPRGRGWSVFGLCGFGRLDLIDRRLKGAPDDQTEDHDRNGQHDPVKGHSAIFLVREALYSEHFILPARHVLMLYNHSRIIKSTNRYQFYSLFTFLYPISIGS